MANGCKVTIRYVCRKCGWCWSRLIGAPQFMAFPVPFEVPECAGCGPEDPGLGFKRPNEEPAA